MSTSLAFFTRHYTLLIALAVVMALFTFVAAYIPMKAAVQQRDLFTIATIICAILSTPMFILGIRHHDNGRYITMLCVVALGSAHYRMSTTETSFGILLIASIILTTGALVALFAFEKGKKEGADTPAQKD